MIKNGNDAMRYILYLNDATIEEERSRGKARKATAKAEREEEMKKEVAYAYALQATEANQQRQDESVGAKLQWMQITGSLREARAVKQCKHGYDHHPRRNESV